ncbi:hypothetical protein [Mucilaginibacter sp.]|uniref:hypothetical protein n=1 Tax=Mucilaginibacter sp. TaxID=1882438 RepID=UPI0035BBAEC2
MRAIFTKTILEFLISKGYRYCLSKTSNQFNGKNSVCIDLYPIKEKPVIKNLPPNTDTYFSIIREPLILAQGVDDTDVFVSLDDVDLSDFHSSISVFN